MIDVHDGIRIKSQEEVADEARENAAEQARSDDSDKWGNEYENVPNTDPSPKLPPDPQVNIATFLKALGVAGGIATLMAAGAIILNSLTSDQENLAQRLYKDFGSSGLTLDDIRDIIEKNPNLSETQLRELLSQYANVIAANPNLVKKYGALAVFEEFIALAAYDAGHGGNYPSKQPMVNMPTLQFGIEEATAEMGAMEEGLVPWPLTPSTDPDYDAVDPTGQKWDEKSYRSTDTNGNPYNPVQTVQKLKKDINKGEKIIFDGSCLTQKEIDDTYEAVKKNHMEGDVVWWPTQPTP